VPALADSWEVSADGLTYTFHLNPEATWHDGTPVTADDVAFSFDRQSNPKTGSSYTGTFTQAVASWNVVDDHTIEVIATSPNADFLFDAYCPIMPKHIWESISPEDWSGDPGSTGQDPSRVIGTGPFIFEGWTQGETVVLAANPDYYGPKPQIEGFTYRVWPEATQSVEALRAGEIDVVVDVPAADTEEIKNADGLDVAIYPTYGFTFYAYNLDSEKTELFQDLRVRQALFIALDRESIVNDIFLGYPDVAVGTQPLLSPAYAPDEVATQYAFDPDRSRQLLEEAGWRDSDGDGIREKDGQPLAFEITYPSGTPENDRLVTYMQQAWKEVGAEVTPVVMQLPALIKVVAETFEYDVALLGLNFDATGNQGALFNCDQYKVGFNVMKYCNPKVDELNQKARTTLDPEEHRALLVEAMNITNDDLPIGPLLFRNDRTGYNDRLQNFHPTGASLLWSIPYVWIAP
jgi:peptide/nickel transport system substrate-binding protein